MRAAAHPTWSLRRISSQIGEAAVDEPQETGHQVRVGVAREAVLGRARTSDSIT